MRSRFFMSADRALIGAGFQNSFKNFEFVWITSSFKKKKTIERFVRDGRVSFEDLQIRLRSKQRPYSWAQWVFAWKRTRLSGG